MNVPRGIEVIENAFDQSDEIVRQLDSANHWKPSKIGKNPGISDLRTSSTCTTPYNSAEKSPLFDDFRQTMLQIFKNYSFTYNVKLTSFEPSTFNRYQVNEEFNSHADYFEGSNRVVSAVTFLNNVEDGGNLLFDFLDYQVQPVAGRVVIFPSNFLFTHQALPPTKGTKYSAAFWARG